MMPDNTWIQYGCFGVLAFIMIFGLVRVIPSALATHRESLQAITNDHKEAIGKLVASFEEEAEQCRSERIENAKIQAAQSEAERKSRHEIADKFQNAFAEMTHEMSLLRAARHE